MNWAVTKNAKPVPVKDIPEYPLNEFLSGIDEKMEKDRRVLGLFGVPLKDNRVQVFCVLSDDENSRLLVSSSVMDKVKDKYRSLTPKYPAFHLFERELHENHGIAVKGHPSLKPVRSVFAARGNAAPAEEYPFDVVEGDEVHEVGVGPIHAGIIEPGHFRFSCLAEKVLNLEIHLGYQHRGVEGLMEAEGRLDNKIHIAESISGDSVIAHATCYAQAVEGLCGLDIPMRAEAIRAIGLEMERAGYHIGDLAALSNDIAFLPGNAVFGVTRTVVINSLLELCGSRFGRGLIRPGGVGFGIDRDLSALLSKNLKKALRSVERTSDLLFSSASVLSRFEQTGIVTREEALAAGLVGPAARASGLTLDVRADHPFGIFTVFPFHKVSLETGDVFARAYIRYVEIMQSIGFVMDLLENLPPGEEILVPVGAAQKSALCISMTEGFRGETVHCALTGKKGELVRYKIIDPSFHNWTGLEIAVRGNGISDFPLCNKSFNLSYCGYDL